MPKTPWRNRPTYIETMVCCCLDVCLIMSVRFSRNNRAACSQDGLSVPPQLHLPLGCPWWPLAYHAPLMSGTRSGDSDLSSLIRIWRSRSGKHSPPKPGVSGQYKVGSCVEVVFGCRVLHYIVSYSLSLVIMLTLCVENHSLIFSLTFRVQWRRAFRWHGVW